MAPECSGATDLDVSDDHTQLLLPIRIFIDPAPRARPACPVPGAHHDPRAGPRARHLPAFANGHDIMFADPGVEAPSERDRGTRR